MVERFRILMANQLKLMRQLLVEMLEESWIEIVGDVTQESEIRELVEKTALTFPGAVKKAAQIASSGSKVN